MKGSIDSLHVMELLHLSTLRRVSLSLWSHISGHVSQTHPLTRQQRLAFDRVLSDCGDHPHTPHTLHSTHIQTETHAYAGCVPNRTLTLVRSSAVHFSVVHLLCGALISTGECCSKSRPAVLHFCFANYKQAASNNHQYLTATHKSNAHHKVNALLKCAALARSTLAS